MTEIPINVALDRYAKPVSLCLFVLVLTFATTLAAGCIDPPDPAAFLAGKGT